MNIGNILSASKNATPQFRHYHKGLSLLELLTSTSIAATLISISLSGMSNLLEQQSQKNILFDLYHLTTLTRTLAVRNETYFTLCSSENGRQCNNQWNKQVIVFEDSNKNEQVDGKEVIYRVWQIPKTLACLQWKSGRNYLQFRPTGASNGTAGHFRFCDTDHNYLEKKLVISFNGRTSLKKL